MNTLTKYQPQMLGILRIVAALVYMEHGTQKLFHFPPMARFGGGGAGGRAVQAVKQGADAASSAMSSAVDAASSAMSSAVDTVSSMISSAPPPATPSAPPDGMPPSMQTIFLIGGIIEMFGGLALVLGLLTRPVAFIVAGELAVIYWWMHVPRGGLFPVGNGGESAVLMCFTFLYLVFAGPGAFALDNLMKRKAT
jgi:putative oxidoreductase